MAFVNLGQVVYPIGAIYMSSSNISPANLFGGTWEEITDQKFWLPSSSYNTQGGEWNHILSVEEMPYHYHNVQHPLEGGGWHDSYFWQTNAGAGSLWWVLTHGAGTTQFPAQTNGKGGNQAHNNVPPYRTCYCWRRKL